ncbi:hypothetical protein VKT23_010852 [Stygiomarasmius scandens]|uniref:DUF6534 domain-containing protein n=1 Tax=Marasmiellus scandens TaxID=2682957 RepID=A0ABR1JG09_9AGAR
MSRADVGLESSKFSIDNTFGAGLIGAFITAMLYGLTTLQTYVYFNHYPKDEMKVKSLVTNYNNPVELTESHWSLNITVLLNLLLAVLVQSFFTRQVYALCRGVVRFILTAILVISVLLHFVFGIVTVAFLFIHPDFLEFQESNLVKLAGAAPFAIFAVLSDVFIAGSLCYLLYEHRSGFRETNTIITTLIVYAVNRCLLTSAVAITEVIVFVLTPGTLWYLAIDFVIGKLYANSFLASLNSRRGLRTTPRSTTMSTSFSIATPDAFTSNANSSAPARSQVIALDTLRTDEQRDRSMEIDEFADTSTSKRSHPRVKIGTGREDYPA